LKSKTLIVSLVALVVTAGVAKYLTVLKNHNMVGQSQRLPAAIPKIPDISELTGSALETAAKRRLLSGAKSIVEGDSFGVSLGHFITKGLDGRAAFACDVYDRVTLTFLADGIAVSGERPSLTVEANCDVASDVTRLATIWVPVGEIKNGKPVDSEIRVNEPSEVAVKLSNMVSEWPSTWVLSNIKLSSRKDSKSIELDSTNLYQMMDSQISMRW
jgi:hypothetical protein